MTNVIWKHISLVLTAAYINTSRPRQNGRHFADDTVNHIFVNENVRISIKFSLKFVPKGPINNIPALFQIMAWHRSGDKPLSEPMMVSLPTHICVTRPQWVNTQHSWIQHFIRTLGPRQASKAGTKHFRGYTYKYLHTHTFAHVYARASYQICKIAGCACAENAGNVFPATDFKENR